MRHFSQLPWKFKSEYLGADGKPLLGPNGELLGSDGQPIRGANGEILGMGGTPISEANQRTETIPEIPDKRNSGSNEGRNIEEDISPTRRHNVSSNRPDSQHEQKFGPNGELLGPDWDSQCFLFN